MSTLFRTLTVAASTVLWLAACSSLPQPRDDGSLQREAVAGTERPPPPPLNTATPAATPAVSIPGQISVGTGVFVRATAAGRTAAAEGPPVTFNFENQPIQAVAKAILGDLLKKNYAIAPGVSGNITFATAEPVSQSQALPILNTLLGWTGNALVQQDGTWLVVPQKDAVAGNLTPGLGALAPGNGLRAEMFTLNYISASEMKKLLQPFARDNAFLLVDSARNLLVLAGTPQQLANYQRTIRTFDVDWLKGMSVGVFSLQHASVGDLMPQLDKMFGEHGSTPLAGMLRFIPIERTNAIVVISPQPDYLREVHNWIERIDQGGGNQPQLYVYDVKNLQAGQLAGFLNQIYNGGSASGAGDSDGAVGPGLESATITSGFGGDSDTGDGSTSSDASMAAGKGSSSMSMGSSRGGSQTGAAPGNAVAVLNDSSTGASGGGSAGSFAGNGNSNGINITAVNQNNQLLVRCRPSQWNEIRAAIDRLDIVPLQVQIETRILEVQLTGEFQFGVQWYLQGLAGGVLDDGVFSPGDPTNRRQGALGGGGNAYNPVSDSLFYSFLSKNLDVAVHAMQTNGNAKVLSEPSLVVTNNHLAKIQVGDQVPVNQTFFAPGLGNTGGDGGISTLGQVQYKDTGVILKVRPRVNPGGLVYLTLDQIVSKPGVKDAYGNFPIQKRELNTQIAVQSGQTVLLGGLIQQDEGSHDTGVPFLSRIPVIGRLFGTTNRSRNRTELLLLITPRVITSSTDAAEITSNYQRKFESLAPLRTHPEAKATEK